MVVSLPTGVSFVRRVILVYKMAMFVNTSPETAYLDASPGTMATDVSRAARVRKKVISATMIQGCVYMGVLVRTFMVQCVYSVLRTVWVDAMNQGFATAVLMDGTGKCATKNVMNIAKMIHVT